MRTIHTFATDYGTVRLSEAVADRLKWYRLYHFDEPGEDRAWKFSAALGRWLAPLYASGSDIERITIRLSQYHRWTLL